MNKRLTYIMILVGFMLSCRYSHAQSPTDSIPKDPGGLFVYTVQNLVFGAFTAGINGGTVNVAPDGIRTATGDVLLLNMGLPVQSAIFEFEAPPGAIISILNAPPVTLYGSNGGSLNLTLSNPDPVTPFITTAMPPFRTEIRFGGTLTIGNNVVSPAGNYTGTFHVTFHQE